MEAMAKILKVAVIAPPGYFRASLLALLITSPHVARLIAVNDFDDGLDRLSKEKPEVVILDASDLNASVHKIEFAIRRHAPDTRIIVLAEPTGQGRSRDVKLGDYMLTRGVSAGELFGLLTHLADQSHTVRVSRNNPQPV